MITYLIVEGETGKNLLEHILPDALKQHILIVLARNTYDAQTTGSSILMTRHNPVVLVINANTEDKRRIEERRAGLYQFLGNNLAWADAVYEVFMAVPSLESALFGDTTNLENLSALLTPDVLEKARQHPLIVELSQFIQQHSAEKQPS